MYTFDEIWGYKKIITNLQNAIRKNKISHSYIMDGNEGAGKKLLANTFAKTLQCENGDVNPCGACVSCKAFDSKNHPDVFYVTKTKTKNIGVDDIREQVLKHVDIKPYKYKHKIFIFDEAHTMSPTAQNAILKTIEEPPAFAVFFFLTTNASMLLQTVLSRCVMLKLKPLPSETVHSYLVTQLGADENEAHFLCEYAGGSIGQAVKLNESEHFFSMREFIIDVLKRIKDTDLVSLLLLVKEFEKYKENIYEILDMAYLWYRDILTLKKVNSRFVVQKDKMADIREEAGYISEDSIYKNLDAILSAKKNLSFNANFQLTLEILLINMKEKYI